MEVMCHSPRGRKSKSLDKIKKEKMRERHVARRKVRGNFPLESSGSNSVGEKEKKGKEKKIKKKENGARCSTLFLRFTEIEPSIFVGA